MRSTLLNHALSYEQIQLLGRETVQLGPSTAEVPWLGGGQAAAQAPPAQVYPQPRGPPPWPFTSARAPLASTQAHLVIPAQGSRGVVVFTRGGTVPAENGKERTGLGRCSDCATSLQPKGSKN